MNLRGIVLCATSVAAVAVIGLAAFLVASPGRVEATTAAVCTQKAFVCKYVGTPYVDERLQTGQNPINVSIHAIPVQPVVVGSYFADRHGRSFVLACATPGQRPEPSVSECPSSVTPTPTPTVTPTPTPTPMPFVTPTPTPTPCPECTPTPTPTPCTDCGPTPTPTPPTGGTTTVGTSVVQAPAPAGFPDTGGAPAVECESRADFGRFILAFLAGAAAAGVLAVGLYLLAERARK